MSYFTIVGKIRKIPNTDKFKTYEEKIVSAKWQVRNVKTVVDVGGSSFFLENNGGCKPDGSGFAFGYVNGNGSQKGHSEKVEWKNRNSLLKNPNLSGMSKWVIDLAPDQELRRNLKALIKKVKDGKAPTPEELANVGVDSVDLLRARLKESAEKRFEFVTEWDFSQKLYELTKADAFKDKLVHIDGERVFKKNPNNGKEYSSLQPKHVYVVNPETEVNAIENVNLYFDGSDVSVIDENATSFTINGYTPSYSSSEKKDVYYKYPVVVRAKNDETGQKIFNFLYEKLSCAGTVNEDTGDEYVAKVPLTVRMINGTEEVQLTIDDLPEDLKELVEYGIMTLRDAINEATHGSSVKSNNKVTENRFMKMKTSKPEPTVITKESMIGVVVGEADEIIIDADDTDSLFDIELDADDLLG